LYFGIDSFFHKLSRSKEEEEVVYFYYTFLKKFSYAFLRVVALVIQALSKCDWSSIGKEVPT